MQRIGLETKYFALDQLWLRYDNVVSKWGRFSRGSCMILQLLKSSHVNKRQKMRIVRRKCTKNYFLPTRQNRLQKQHLAYKLNRTEQSDTSRFTLCTLKHILHTDESIMHNSQCISRAIAIQLTARYRKNTYRTIPCTE